MQVLIVEDDDRIQQFLLSALKRFDPTLYIFVTGSASEAMNIAREQLIDFFIVDIQLVDFKGTDFVKQIRTMPQYQFAPIVFETAITTEELYAYRELKCFYYLVKPYTELELHKVMKDVVAFLAYASVTPEEPTLTIIQKGFIFEYYLKDIAYIESFGKKLCLHLQHDEKIQEVMISSYSLKKMLELLDERFIQVHKSYIVNRDKIEVHNKTQQILKLRGIEGAIPVGLKFHDALNRVKK